jgi:hypothetical protein
MHKYNNQDHAMMTAMLTAKNILAGARPLVSPFSPISFPLQPKPVLGLRRDHVDV